MMQDPQTATLPTPEPGFPITIATEAVDSMAALAAIANSAPAVYQARLATVLQSMQRLTLLAYATSAVVGDRSDEIEAQVRAYAARVAALRRSEPTQTVGEAMRSVFEADPALAGTGATSEPASIAAR